MSLGEDLAAPPRPTPPGPPMVAAPLPGSPGIAVRRVGKTRNPWGVWLLSLVTFGIYALWWYYKVNDEVRSYDRNIVVSPGMALCAQLFGWVLCGIPPLVSAFTTGERIGLAQASSGSPHRASGVLGLLLFLFGFGTWVVYYQSQLNKVWDQYGNPAEGTVVSLGREATPSRRRGGRLEDPPSGSDMPGLR